MPKFFNPKVFTSNDVSVNVTMPASKRSSRRSPTVDPELLSDKSQLVKCLTKAGLVVKVKEETNLLMEDKDNNKLA